jgi:DNA polymerase III delta prime subunit
MNILTETYRPRKIADFIGIDKPKTAMLRLVASPKSSAYLFVGKSGIGKTALALALAEEIGGELHHIPSQKCTVDAVEIVRRKCQYLPMLGKNFHVILVDEADSMSNAAQDAWLSLLDSTGRPQDTIIIFTCNDAGSLKDRFKSRCFIQDFTTQGLAPKIAKLLSDIWLAEAPANAPAPNFLRIANDAHNNVRTALMELENSLPLA